jgi:hypothetical protein
MFKANRLLSYAQAHRSQGDRLSEVRLMARGRRRGKSCDPAMRNLEESSLFIIINSLFSNRFNIKYIYYFKHETSKISFSKIHYSSEEL